MLWQLPANLPYDADVLATSSTLLPRTTGEAAELATRHDDRLSGDKLWSGSVSRTDRCATRSSHATRRFDTDEARRSARRTAGVALVVADSAGKWPRFEQAIGPFVYVRLHGDKELYASGYTDDALDRWAEKLTRLDRRRAGRVRLLRQRHEGLRAARRDAADRATEPPRVRLPTTRIPRPY